MSKKYSMKVYPAGRGRDVYRNIEICGDESLNRLCGIILEAFDFIDEHLLFRGAVGTGKSFLDRCIASALLELEIASY